MIRPATSPHDRPTDTVDHGSTASVVIATYNRPTELNRLIQCLADQERHPLEVIVVDDGSDPAAHPTFPRDTSTSWRCIRQVNRGPAAARHIGITEARGDIVIIVDDDMVVTPRFVVSHLERHAAGADVVQGRFDNRDAAHRPLFDRFVDAQQAAYFDRCTGDPSAVDPTRLSTGNVSVRRQVYLDSGGFDMTLRRREDTELGIRLATSGARFDFAPERTAVHDEPPESLRRWLQVAYEYGTSEAMLADRHPNTYDPWTLLDDMPSAARRLVSATMHRPKLMAMIGRAAARFGQLAEVVHVPSIAVRGYGAGFALHWFAGMSEAFGPAAARVAYASRRSARDGLGGASRVMFGGVGVDVIGLHDAVARIIELSGAAEPSIVVTPNVDHLVLYRRDPVFAKVYDQAALVLADGAPLILLSRLLRLPLREKVSGSDLVHPLAAAAARSGTPVYLLGASDEVTAAAAQRMTNDHRDLTISGRSSPMFSRGEPNSDLAESLEQVRSSGARLVFLAFGTPKEEHLLDQFAGRLPQACFVCCGASLDFAAGRVRRAPRWLSAIGMEWTFRLALEPRRLWKRYLVQDVAVLPLFISMTVHRLLGERLVHPRHDSDPNR
jgi:exopolysaccharide biosynthesis WecB/TagA/CpsF family protein